MEAEEGAEPSGGGGGSGLISDLIFFSFCRTTKFFDLSCTGANCGGTGVVRALLPRFLFSCFVVSLFLVIH